MALILSDGFSLYNSSTGASLFKGWTVSGGSQPSYQTGGRWGTGSSSVYISSTGSSNAYMTQNVATNGSTTIVGIAIQPNSLTSNGARLFSITNGAATVALTWAGSGKLALTDGGTTTYYTLSSGLTYTWYYVELKVVWSATAGRIVFRIDTSQFYDSGATLNLGSSLNTTNFTIGSSTTAGSLLTYFTDFLLMDGTSTTFNDFQGDVRIETLQPTADGANTGWSLPNDTLLASANQSRFTVDTSGWTTLSGTPSFSRNATGGPSAAIPTSMSLGGSGSIITTPNGASGFPVTPGQTLALGAYSKINTGFSTSVLLRFYDSSGTVLGSDLNLGILNNSAGPSWVWNNMTGTVPSGAATCAIILSPNGSGASTGFVLSATTTNPAYVDPAGAHYFETSENVHDGDQSYVKTNAVGAKDTYVMSDLKSTSGNILAVRTILTARKESASTHTVSTVTRVNGTDYVGTSMSPPNTLSYQMTSDFYPTSPATGTAWTRTEVNNLEAGADLTA